MIALATGDGYNGDKHYGEEDKKNSNRNDSSGWKFLLHVVSGIFTRREFHYCCRSLVETLVKIAFPEVWIHLILPDVARGNVWNGALQAVSRSNCRFAVVDSHEYY